MTSTATDRMRTPHVLIVSSRPLSWINTAYPFAVAYWLLTHTIDWYLIVGTLFFLGPYNLLMYGINDVFDYESDAKNPRKGGVEGALVAQSHHRVIILFTPWLVIPPALALGLGADLVTSVVLATTLFLVVAYSAPRLRFKEVPFLDSVTSASHFVGPAAVGVLAASARYGVYSNSAPVLLGAFFAWSMASHAFGAVQDIEPDRRANLRSLATVIGGRYTVRFSVVFYVLSSIILFVSGNPSMWLAPIPLAYALHILPWWNVNNCESASSHAGWVRFLWMNYVAGFLITMFIIVSLGKPHL